MFCIHTTCEVFENLSNLKCKQDMKRRRSQKLTSFNQDLLSLQKSHLKETLLLTSFTANIDCGNNSLSLELI